MAAVRLAFWFDAEDYVSPYEPVCLRRLAALFARRGLPATWKLVGEEARMLRRAAAGAGEGGRDAGAAREALAAIAAQGLGFHTDWHSRHPTVAEYCTGAGWEEGQRRFEAAEGPGLAALREAFPGTAVACYGQPGGSWAPQAYPLLRRWGIPLYMDEAGHLGCGEQPFFFCGILNVLRLRRFCVRRRGHRPPAEGAAEALADLDRIAGELRARGGGLAQCWWHPNEFYTDQWWDGLNFGAGRNRAGPDAEGGPRPYRLPAPVAQAEREQRFASMAEFLDGVARNDGIRVCGAAEIVALYPDRARGRPFAASELTHLAHGLGDLLSFQRVGEATLSAAEAAYLLASALAGPPGAEVVLDASPDGPACRTAPTVPASAALADVREAAARFVGHVRSTGRLPDALPLAGGMADPACLALAFAAAHRGAGRTTAGFGGGPAAGPRVPLAAGRLAAEDFVSGDPGVWSWSIFPEGFRADDLIEQARLQAWTLKPALPAG